MGPPIHMDHSLCQLPRGRHQTVKHLKRIGGPVVSVLALCFDGPSTNSTEVHLDLKLCENCLKITKRDRLRRLRSTSSTIHLPRFDGNSASGCHFDKSILVQRGSNPECPQSTF